MDEEDMEAILDRMRSLGFLNSEALAERMREQWRALDQLGPVAVSLIQLEGERLDRRVGIMDILLPYSEGDTSRTLAQLYEAASQEDRRRVDTLLAGLSLDELFV